MRPRPRERSLPEAPRQGWRVWGDRDGAGGPDDSLTSLQWLQEFSFLPAPSPTSFSGVLQGTYGPASPPAGDTAAEGMPPGTGRPTPSSTSLPQPPAPASRTDPRAKPPYSYATLICMAMRASPRGRLSLAAIYAWIAENFCYFRHAEPNWQNSVRHNLSLNRCFQKVPRGKDEPGKGGLWQIDPRYAHTLAHGGFPRKRMPALPSPAAHTQPGPCQRRERPGSLRGKKGRQPPPLPAPGVEMVDLLGPRCWTSGLEATLGAAATTSEELELRAALGALAPPEDLPPLSQPPPLGTPSHGGPASSPPADADGALVQPPEPLAEPWEEAVVEEPLLGAGWEEEDPCFAPGFLVEMQPWEG